MRTTVVIRVDGSSQIGLGHLVRSAALAGAVRRRGGRAMFVTKTLGGTAARFFRQHGLPYAELPDNLDEPSDAEVTLEVAHDEQANVVLIDHYTLGEDWWLTVASESLLAAIDDVGRPNLWPAATLVLNQNAGASTDWYRNVPHVLCGPRYAVLRSEFFEQTRAGVKRGPLPRLLITLGGADPDNATLLAVEAASNLPCQLGIDVVIGPAFGHRQVVVDRCESLENVVVHQQSANLAALMARADLAITGGGSTAYESAYLGLPSILLELADNQSAVCRAMDAAGTARFAGRASQLSAAALGQMMARLLANPEERLAMSRAGQSLVDGQGAERVATALENLATKSRVVSAT